MKSFKEYLAEKISLERINKIPPFIKDPKYLYRFVYKNAIDDYVNNNRLTGGEKYNNLMYCWQGACSPKYYEERTSRGGHVYCIIFKDYNKPGLPVAKELPENMWVTDTTKVFVVEPIENVGKPEWLDIIDTTTGNSIL